MELNYPKIQELEEKEIIGMVKPKSGGGRCSDKESRFGQIYSPFYPSDFLFFPRESTWHFSDGDLQFKQTVCVIIWVLLFARGVCGSVPLGPGPAALGCFPNAQMLVTNAQSVNLISGLRKGERCRKKGESAGEAARASDNSRKHQPGFNLLSKCDMNKVILAGIYRFQKSLIFFLSCFFLLLK